MKTKICFLFILFATFVCTQHALAALWYVDSAASGSNNGTSWTNAWEELSNISWGSISASDTIYISGGTTSKTYTSPLDVRASGSPGSPITITVGQASPHNGIVIIDDSSDARGIIVNGYDYVSISGRVVGNSTKHIITRNHSNQEIYVNNTNTVVVEYIEVGPHSANGYCVNVDEYLDGGNRISNCEIHGCNTYGIVVSPPGGGTIINDNHLRIDHNKIYDFGEDGIHTGRGAGGVTIDHNEIHDPSDLNWAGYSDGMQLRGFNYLTVAYNKVYNIENADGMYSYIYLECDLSQSNVAANDIYIYNNVIYETDLTYTSSGHTGISFGCKACATMTNVEISNNTLVDLGSRGIDFGTGGATTSNTYIMNNIVYNCDRGGFNAPVVSLNPAGASTGSLGNATNIQWDYNLVDNYGSRNLYGRYNNTTVNYSTTWNTISGCDHSGQTSDPTFVNWSEGNTVDLHLSEADTAATNTGTTRTELSDDHDSIPRPQGAAWDIGAYERVLLAAPRNLTIVDIQ